MTESEQKRAYDAKPKIIIESEDFGEMLCSALRYAMGRMTYIVKDTADYIRPLIPYLSDNTLQNMERDITRNAEMNFLGMNMDAEIWLALRTDIVNEINARKESS